MISKNSLSLSLLLAAALALPCACKPPAPPQPAPVEEAAHDEHHDEVVLSADAVKNHGITITPARKQILTRTFSAPARVALNADAMAHVGSVLRGRVVDLKVKIGDTVAKGDELLIVESADLGEAQSDYLQKIAAVAIATPAVELAHSAHDRGKKLFEESQGITLTELQRRAAELQSAQAVLQSAESIAKMAENKLRLLGMNPPAVAALAKSREIQPRYAITAPIAGQLLEREVTLGELVSPDRDALLVLADLASLWVLADVPELRLAQVPVGTRAQVTVPAFPGPPLDGAVTFLAPTLDPNTRTATVRIQIKPNGQNLRPGMFAQALITESDPTPPEPVLAIPEEATQLVEGQLVVFVPVEGEDNTFTPRPVQVGTPVGPLLPLLSGLKEGEPFVATGSFILKAQHSKGSAEHHH